MPPGYCCRPFRNIRKVCSSKKRNLSKELIAKLTAMNCAIPLNTSMKICDTCRLLKPEEVGSSIDEATDAEEEGE